MRRSTSMALAALVTLVAGVSAGCSSSSETAPKISHPYAIPTSAVQVPLRGVNWMQGSTLHVDGRAVDVGVRAQSYALLPDGVLLSQGEALFFSDTRSRARRVASGVLGLDGVHVSPDGRYVGFLDAARGPTDRHGDHFYRLDVLDTRTGRQVLAGVKGMGDLDESDGLGVAEQYEEADPELVGLDDRAAYVRGIGGSWRYPLDGTAPRRLADDATVCDDCGPGRSSSIRLINIDGDFRPVDTRTGRKLEIALPSGANKFAPGGWLSGQRFWGFALRGRYAAVVGTGRMVTCSVPDRSCTPVSGRLTSTNERLVLVDGYSGQQFAP